MKKLIIIALLAVIATGCTNLGIEEDQDIQTIDKEEVETARDKKQGN